jgi:ataxia telangiectasia mutated family protein
MACSVLELKQLLSKGKIAGHLDDKGFLKMYETIFRACDADKTPLNKQSKPAITRFSTCGSVLRAAVELGVKRLKIKTVQAVYRHILDIFPVGHTLGGSLSVDYFKALRVLFQYAPHTEHLPSENWEELANFCCAQVQSQLGLPDTDQDDDVEMREMVEVEDRNPRGRVLTLVHEDSNSSRGSASGSGPRLPATVRLSHESEELLECLRYLLASPNAPVRANAEPVCNTLLGFFRSQPTETRAHQHVFSSLNYVLNVATTNDLALVHRVSEAILPVICRLWDTRTSGLKDEMIISLIYCQPHIRARIRSSEGSALRKSVEDLFDTLWSEYISRADREMLQLDDLSFPSVIDEPAIMAPLSIRAISLRTNMQNPRAEQTWMIPNLLASLVEMLDVSSDYSRRTPENSESDGTRKRQRMYRESSEIMRFVRSNNIPRKLLALQVVSFLADLKGIDEEEFPSIMQDFQEACSDDNSAITGWALIAMGRYLVLPILFYAPASKLLVIF